ncbi:MAG: ATP-binding protein [Bdellovibrio sp.]
MWKFFKSSLRRQIIIGITATHAVLILYFVFDMVSWQSKFLHQEYKDTVEGLAQGLAANSTVWTLARDYSGLQEVVSAQKKYSNVKMAMVFNLDGKILAHTEPDKIGMFVDTTKHPQLLSPENKGFEVSESDQNSISAVKNIESNGIVLGKVWVVLSEDHLHASLKKISSDGFLYFFIAISMGAVLALVVTNAMTKRLKELVLVAEGVKRGEQNQRVRLSSNDELAQLGDAFNSMLDGLEKKQKNLEQSQAAAKAANQAKSDFLANMSHEIRTPINTMVGMADVLADTPLTEEQNNFVKIFQRAGENLTNLVNDILDLSKIEAGQLKIKNENFSVRELLNDLEMLCRETAIRKNLSLTFDVAEDVPSFIVGDKDRVRQILMNFVSNAMKFTEKGHVEVRAFKSLKPGFGEAVHFAVKDTGIGIPHDKTELLFERFQQIDSSSSRKAGGTGLGLAISKKLVNLMGGEIGYESQHSAGSKFFFSLPLKEAFEKESVRLTARSFESGNKSYFNNSCQKNILLVDDSDDNRLLVKAYLKDMLVNIVECKNGQEALDLFKENRFDLVLLDLQMPVLDGYEAIRLMRQWENQNGQKTTPVVALSADSIPELIEKALTAGCDSHVSKPFRKKTLIDVVVQTVSFEL